MPLVAANRIAMHFGGPHLLDGVTLAVEPGARIGLIGANGSGKSTLLRLLQGRLDPTDGSVVSPKSVRIAYQAQELEFAPGATVREELREVFDREARLEAELRRVETELAAESDATTRDRLLAEYARLQARQEAGGVYDVDRRIEGVLASLGLPAHALDRPIDEFSGGERNVIGLARVLLAEPDLMLLDEPSNHLDMDGVEWFIGFLRRTKAAVVMVSHNRHLLDATVDTVWELERRRVTAWTGNYSDYQRQRAEALARQERQYKTQQRLIQRIQFQARRLMDMANAYDDPGQAKRAKAMLKRIDRMDQVERPQSNERRFKATLKGGARHGRIALSVKDFSFAHGDRVLFDAASLDIEYGERVCLVGANGSGKTTLFRHILDEGSWENPQLRLGRSVKVGEYRQLHDVLDAGASLVDWTCGATGLIPKEASALLHRFLFTREDLDRSIGTLSGGEKSRLQLARLAHAKVNFLLLDEPTNHLDIQACEVLEEMLEGYDGTLLVISHDRYFLDKLVDRVVEVANRGLEDHPCTFAQWWRDREGDGRRGALADHAAVDVDKTAAREAFHSEKERRRVSSRRRSRIRELERAIEEHEVERRDLEQRIETAWAAAPEDPTEPRALARRFEALGGELTTMYAEWEQLAQDEAESEPE